MNTEFIFSNTNIITFVQEIKKKISTIIFQKVFKIRDDENSESLHNW